ncbi:Tetratricopeptide TPR_2 repeat protein [Methanococcus vannielii SB]|uniref:Tetratricopeptide TPR_2 repeat protein n=1 Tax=Methanococcus vannielii (strain ATCC 35089 / DSM 1224 / JCM 13029 / OCM 148 / SB) TaxID=406327 RepID=A6UPF0_METVS|nr:hypothetical protein [Methanococcus vannielii]ABR54372.1 Tetratricopeptide TPR_2 repeat protein [Methanococcus vannielii SB]
MEKKRIIITLISLFIVFAGCLGNKDPESYYINGVEKYNSGDYNGAIFAFDSAIQLNPEETKYWLMKGKSLYGLQRYEESADCYGYILTVIKDEYNKDVWAELAKSLDNIEGKESAAENARARAK